MFTKILIANRGEIACRVIQTAHRLGIKTVAVYSDADRNALHVELADEACYIGPAPASKSYLNADAILDAARLTGAQAIHPGYGFLSENPDFVSACDEAGIRFIGPSADAIRAMGLKDAAKRLMVEAGVPVVPGYHGSNQDDNFLAEQAQAIGYPVLIKARAGGGGKGMRKVEQPGDFFEALQSARRESLSSFSDDSVLVEKFVSSPRHIEIQVFGDDHGNMVYLFERDCSLQRRHQKVIEEAPAPGMNDTMRQAMGEAAVCAAKAVNYSGAGTVEFIVDATNGLKPESFYFMEMNTRLQVEHPVTEAIVGQDLVEWQLLVANGQDLPLNQQQLTINGHAFEARIYAEDAARGFLPSTGTLTHLQMPEHLARLDTGVRSGDTITPFYDPMIAKLIVHGKDRETALSLLSNALRHCQIAGCTTNIGFLERLSNQVDFVSGNVDTALIERNMIELCEESAAIESDVIACILAANLINNETADDPWANLKGWRQFGNARQYIQLAESDRQIEAILESAGSNDYVLVMHNQQFQLSLLKLNDQEVRIEINKQIFHANYHFNAQEIWIFQQGKNLVYRSVDQLGGDDSESSGEDVIRAPMPGQIIEIRVSPGNKVKKGDVLGVMEAMKMEQSLLAPRDGEIELVAFASGDQVAEGSVLISLVTDAD
ncbi:MAG: 3-methylcrotonyl-CoA carboxylase alpha subunit [Parasphingorhabdus sp.]|jgi:3-methylcrotonyl-CoA carboxylase alpha subunit